MQESPYEATVISSESKKRKQSPFPRALIIFSFSLLFLGAILDFMAENKTEPDSDDFSDDGYDKAYEEYTETVKAFSAISDLFFVCGTITLGAGLFFYATEASGHLPDYVRTALMLGAMYFLIRMLTTEMSIADQLALLSLVS